MSAGLALRIATGRRLDLALDAELLDWLAEEPGFGRTDRWLAHARGLTGDLSGALRLLDDLLPNAAWRLRSERREPSDRWWYRASIVPIASRNPVCATSLIAANALLAATLTAYARQALKEVA